MKCCAFNAGFTVIELLVTLSVASIVLTVAVPSFSTLVQDSRLVTQSNDFLSALMLAKSEAIKSNRPATICPSTNGSACTGGKIWSDGWIVFSDTDRNGAVDAGEEVIQVGTAFSGGNTLQSSNLSRVTFLSSGFSLGFMGSFSLCDSRGANHSRRLVLNMQGRVRTEVGTGVCT